MCILLKRDCGVVLMQKIRRLVRAGASLFLVAGLWACDAPPSAVVKPGKSQSQAHAERMSDNGAANAYGQGGDRASARDDAPMVDGVPLWTSTRKLSAQENAKKHFERDGDAFGATSVDDFVSKAHSFVRRPPKGTLTILRTNGDTLFYNPKDNVFAVTTKSGAPRTLFKPDDGPAYWQEQVDREAQRKQGRSDRDQG